MSPQMGGRSDNMAPREIYLFVLEVLVLMGLLVLGRSPLGRSLQRSACRELSRLILEMFDANRISTAETDTE